MLGKVPAVVLHALLGRCAAAGQFCQALRSGAANACPDADRGRSLYRKDEVEGTGGACGLR